jgi:hypothetical protein
MTEQHRIWVESSLDSGGEVVMVLIDRGCDLLEGKFGQPVECGSVHASYSDIW